MSAETDALEAFLNNTGLPHKVTCTTGGVHAPNSYHYRGLAVDFAGPVPTRDSAALLNICAAFEKIESRLAELIYAGAPYQIKNGRRVAPSFYGVTTMANHHDHVHVAVESGFRWNAPTQKVTPMWDPPECFVAALDAPEKGVWLLKADGAIFALGGADYKGAANGKPYFVGRKAARLEASGDSYTIIATSGERYGPGF